MSLKLSKPEEEGEEDYWLVKPEPGFCVKFKDNKNGFGKVFINFATCHELPAPAQDLDEDGLAKIIESEDPSRFKIPLSTGELHMEEDKSGGNCAVVDIIINKVFFLTRVEGSELFKTFLVLLGIDAIEKKHKISLDQQGWVLLKNRRNVGNLNSQNLKKKPTRPLIQEISSSSDVHNESESQLPEPESKMTVRQDSKEQRIFELTFNLPGVATVAEIDLQMNEDRVRLEVLEKFLTDFCFPVLISPDSVKSCFDNETHVLKVTAYCQ